MNKEKYEKIEIGSVMEIATEESIVFREKEIYITGEIMCWGELQFENCNIYWGKPSCMGFVESVEEWGKILLEDGARLVLEKCKVFGKGIRVEYGRDDIFIWGKQNSSINIAGCWIYDAEHMMRGQKMKRLCIKNSEFYGFLNKFAEVELINEGCFLMEESRVIYRENDVFLNIRAEEGGITQQEIQKCSFLERRCLTEGENLKQNQLEKEGRRIIMMVFPLINMAQGRISDTVLKNVQNVVYPNIVIVKQLIRCEIHWLNIDGVESIENCTIENGGG